MGGRFGARRSTRVKIVNRVVFGKLSEISRVCCGFLHARKLVVYSAAHGIEAAWVVEHVSSPCLWYSSILEFMGWI